MSDRTTENGEQHDALPRRKIPLSVKLSVGAFMAVWAGAVGTLLLRGQPEAPLPKPAAAKRPAEPKAPADAAPPKASEPAAPAAPERKEMSPMQLRVSKQLRETTYALNGTQSTETFDKLSATARQQLWITPEDDEAMMLGKLKAAEYWLQSRLHLYDNLLPSLQGDSQKPYRDRIEQYDKPPCEKALKGVQALLTELRGK